MAITINIEGDKRAITEWGYTVTDRLAFTALNYNLEPEDEGWITPDGKALMVKPLQLRPAEYPDPVSVDLPRLRLTDFTAVSGSWEEVCPRGIAGDYFLAADAKNRGIGTNAAFPNNAGLWLAVQPVGYRGGLYTIAEITFTLRAVYDYEAGTYSNGSALKAVIRSDGNILLYETGTPDTYLGQGWLSNGRYDFAGRMVQLMILPYRRNSILFLSDGGGWWSWTDPDLPTDLADAWQVTREYGVMLSFPDTRGIFQLLGVKFPSISAEEIARTSTPIKLPYNPTDDPTTDWEADALAGTGVAVGPCASDGSALGVGYWDGSVSDLYYNVMATAGGYYSPAVYKIAVNFPVKYDEAYPTPDDMAEEVLVESLKLSLTEDPSQRTCTLTLRDTEAFTNPEKWHNRRIQVYLTEGLETYQVFDGLTGNNVRKLLSGSSDVIDRLEIECRDHWKLLDKSILNDAKAYDGEGATTAIADLLERAGIDGTDIDGGSATTLPEAQRDEEYLYKPQNGVSIGEFLKELLETHFSDDWVWGFRMADTLAGWLYVFYCNPFDPTPITTLYLDSASAEADSSDFKVLEEWQEEALEIEGNEVWVFGQDSEGGLIVAHEEDTDSQNPDLDAAILAGLDPGLWVGSRWLVIKIDNSLNTQDDVDTVCGILWDRVFKRRRRARVMAEYRPELSPGDCITVDTMGDWRIKSMEATIMEAPDTGDPLTRCEYILEYYGETEEE